MAQQQLIWQLDPIEPPTEPVLSVRDLLTERIPVQESHGVTILQNRPAARLANPPSRPRKVQNLIAVALMLLLLLGGATAVISALLDGADSNPAPRSSPR